MSPNLLPLLALLLAQTFASSLPAAAPDPLLQALSHEAMRHDSPEVLPAVRVLARAGFLERVVALARRRGASGASGPGACSDLGGILERVACALRRRMEEDPRFFLGGLDGLEVAETPFRGRVTDLRYRQIDGEDVDLTLMFRARGREGGPARTCFSEVAIHGDEGTLRLADVRCVGGGGR